MGSRRENSVIIMDNAAINHRLDIEDQLHEMCREKGSLLFYLPKFGCRPELAFSKFKSQLKNDEDLLFCDSKEHMMQSFLRVTEKTPEDISVNNVDITVRTSPQDERSS